MVHILGTIKLIKLYNNKKACEVNFTGLNQI